MVKQKKQTIRKGRKVQILQWRSPTTTYFEVVATTAAHLDPDHGMMFEYELPGGPGAVTPGYAVWCSEHGCWEDGEY